MVYWRVAEQLKARKWREVQRVDGHILDVLCATLGCQPGNLLEHLPEKKRRGRMSGERESSFDTKLLAEYSASACPAVVKGAGAAEALLAREQLEGP